MSRMPHLGLLPGFFLLFLAVIIDKSDDTATLIAPAQQPEHLGPCIPGTDDDY